MAMQWPSEETHLSGAVNFSHAAQQVSGLAIRSRNPTNKQPSASSAARHNTMHATTNQDDAAPPTAAMRNARPSRPTLMVTSSSSDTTRLPPPGSSTTLEEYQARMRQWHNNRVGRKYRVKLNEHFETLQAVMMIESDMAAAAIGVRARQRRMQMEAELGCASVGPHQHHEDDSDWGSEDEAAEATKHVHVGGRTLNKAKVLDMAKAKIGDLTRERETLLREREELLRRLDAVGAAVTAEA